jgi:hypothetical protein
MKRMSLRMLLTVALLAGAMVAAAGQVYGRAKTALVATTGAGSWEFDQPYAAVKLVRIWNEANLLAANTVTVTRVASIGGTAYTQTVGSVAFTSGNGGSTSTFTAGYLSRGDTLLFTSTAATGSTVIVEYEVQEH